MQFPLNTSSEFSSFWSKTPTIRITDKKNKVEGGRVDGNLPLELLII